MLINQNRLGNCNKKNCTNKFCSKYSSFLRMMKYIYIYIFFNKIPYPVYYHSNQIIVLFENSSALSFQTVSLLLHKDALYRMF